MKRVNHDYKKIIPEYDRMIKEMEGKLREKRRKFDEVVKKVKGVPDRHQISRIVEMVNDMGSLKGGEKGEEDLYVGYGIGVVSEWVCYYNGKSSEQIWATCKSGAVGEWVYCSLLL